MKSIFYFVATSIIVLIVAMYSLTGAITPCGGVKKKLEVFYISSLDDLEQLALSTIYKEEMLNVAMVRLDMNELECIQVLKTHYLDNYPIDSAVRSVKVIY